MSVFIDTAVIMYAAGVDHPYRDACRSLIGGLGEGRIDAVTSTEVIQEIFHRFSRGDRRVGVTMAEAALDLFSPLLPISESTMRRMPELTLEYPAMSSRDLIHVAVCLGFGLETIVSPDAGFDMVEGISRLDPVDAALLLS